MIYLDYNATTPIDKQVADAMIPYIYGNFGNPSSSHELGIASKIAVEHAREQVAKLLHSLPEEITFTSGGSESNNTVIKGVAHTYKNKGNHIITSRIEHPAILNPCHYLEKLEYEVSYLEVDEYGMVDPSDIEKLITDKTILVTIMHYYTAKWIFGHTHQTRRSSIMCNRGCTFDFRFQCDFLIQMFLCIYWFIVYFFEIAETAALTHRLRFI